MLGIFKKKTKLQKLQENYEALMKDWHKLSTTNRSQSDLKYQEAQRIMDQIEILIQK